MVDDTPSILRWPQVDLIRARLKHLATAPPADILPAAAVYYRQWFDEHCPTSRAAAREAADLLPSGTNHTLAVNVPFPLRIDRAQGAYLWDADGNRYADFIQAGGATLLGLNHAVVRERVKEVLDECGPALGLSHRYELELARLVREHVPSVEQLRMVASGTEAGMAALRAARAVTGAAHVIKIGGAYHGWADQLVYGMRVPGSGRLGAGGIPDGVLQLTHEVPPNDLDRLRDLLVANSGRGGTAAVVIELLGPQSGTLPVDADYPHRVQDLCREFDALLVADEVITGFRLGPGGAQGQLGVSPDLTMFGKCITGGYPAAGALGGRADVMAAFTPRISTPALVAGTLSANPISCTAGYHSLVEAVRTDAATTAARAGDLLRTGLENLISQYRLPYVTYNFGSIVHLHLSGLFHLSVDRQDFRAQIETRRGALANLTMACAAEGLMISGTGRLFTSMAHTDEVIADVLSRFDRVFSTVAAAQPELTTRSVDQAGSPA